MTCLEVGFAFVLLPHTAVCVRGLLTGATSYGESTMGFLTAVADWAMSTWRVMGHRRYVARRNKIILRPMIYGPSLAELQVIAHAHAHEEQLRDALTRATPYLRRGESYPGPVMLRHAKTMAARPGATIPAEDLALFHRPVYLPDTKAENS